MKIMDLCEFFGVDCLPTPRGYYLPELELEVLEGDEEVADEIRHFWWGRLLSLLAHPRAVEVDWSLRWADEVMEHPLPLR